MILPPALLTHLGSMRSDSIMKKTRYLALTGLLVLVWMCVIFSFSAQPDTQSSQVSGGLCIRIVEDADKAFRLDLPEQQKQNIALKIEHPVRKAAHMTEYAILGMLSFAFFAGIFPTSKKRYAAAIATAALYACTDEFHQYFVPGRSAQFSDVCIDTAGAAVGLLFLYFFIKIIRNHCKSRHVSVQ